jgi:ribulose-phosphate 3-epimerase
MKNLHCYSYPLVSPSILSADPADLLHKGIIFAESKGAKFIHLDVMDGHFVPATTFDWHFIGQVHDQHSMVNDVHIMIEKPWLYAESYCQAGADILTFHYEACPDEESRLSLIEAIHRFGVNVGISIKPATPASVLLPYLEKVDLVLVMSVEPGKGGQAFLPNALTKIALLRRHINHLAKEKQPIIEVDGGINALTGPDCVKAGADLLVSGSYLYKDSEHFTERMASLLK